MKDRPGRVHEWPGGVPVRPLNIAHRGASAHAWENTLHAFETAARLGADMWELDVRLTADGVPVISHDAGLQRVFGADGEIAGLTREQIRTRAPGLPDLDEIIALARAENQALYIEIKASGAGRVAVEHLRRAGFERAVLGSFQAGEVRALADTGCPYPLSVLVRLGDDPFICAEQSGADIVHLCWEKGGARPQDLVTGGLLREAQRRGLGVVLWHEERGDVLADLLELPVLGICTNQPELIAASDPRRATGIQIVCHRGANHFAPENTMASARLCYDQGCPYLEVDVRETADGELVVLHDPTLDRTTDGKGPVADRTLAELRELDAGSWFSSFYRGERIPALREMIALCQGYGRKMYIENKCVDPEKLIAQVEEMNFLDDCFFWSGNPVLQAGLRTVSSRANIKSTRRHYKTVPEMVGHLHPMIGEILFEDYAALADDCALAGVVPMMQYFGDDPKVFERIAEIAPPMLNLDRADLLFAAMARQEASDGEKRPCPSLT